MSLLIENNSAKKSLTSSFSTVAQTTIACNTVDCAPTRTRAIILQKNAIKKPTINRISTLASLLSPSVDKATLNVDITPSSPQLSSAISLLSSTEQPIEQTQQVTSASAVETLSSSSLLLSSDSGRKVFRTMPSFKIMSYQNLIALLTVLVCGLVTVNGLKCYMCGQYNEGVGSITPCLNYSEQYAHLYLKECSKKSEKYCVKYVSELSIVRDCATECAEKEIWETQTYCCTEDGCNASSPLEASAVVVIVPLVIYMLKEIFNVIQQQDR